MSVTTKGGILGVTVFWTTVFLWVRFIDPFFNLHPEAMRVFLIWMVRLFLFAAISFFPFVIGATIGENRRKAYVRKLRDTAIAVAKRERGGAL